MIRRLFYDCSDPNRLTPVPMFMPPLPIGPLIFRPQAINPAIPFMAFFGQPMPVRAIFVGIPRMVIPVIAVVHATVVRSQSGRGQ